MAKKKTEEEIQATPEQGHFEGLEPVKNKRVHAAAKRYLARRNERQAANKEESAAHEALLIAMHDEGLTNYAFGDIEVHVDSNEKCRVKSSAANTEDDE